MTGREQGDELVAQVPVRGRVAVLVALLEQHGEHRVLPGLGAPAGDDVEQQPVEALDRDAEAPPRAARPEIALHERHGQHARHRADGVERAVHGVAQLRRLPLTPRAEDDPQDGLEREVLHPLEGDHAAAPRSQFGPRQLRDRRPEGPHALAVERRLDQPPLAQVLLPVEHEDRVRPGEGPQELPALAGGCDRGVEPEDLTDGVRVREEHERLVHPVGPDGDRIAEPLVHTPEERRRPHGPPDGLPGGGSARAGRQVHGSEATPARHRRGSGGVSPRLVSSCHIGAISFVPPSTEHDEGMRA